MNVLWADEYPDACQELLDPAIVVATPADGDDPARIGAVSVPAGWVPVANALHRDLVALVGDYALVQAGQKGSGLRWLVDPATARCPGVSELLDQARTAAADICTVCGTHGVIEPSPPRCADHPRRTTPHVIARPPGCADATTEETP